MGGLTISFGCFGFMRFISFELSYRIKVKHAILISIIILLFLPFIMLILIDPLDLIIFKDIEGFSEIFLFTVLFLSYLLGTISIITSMIDGYYAAIERGKYDQKILKRFKDSEKNLKEPKEKIKSNKLFKLLWYAMLMLVVISIISGIISIIYYILGIEHSIISKISYTSLLLTIVLIWFLIFFFPRF